MHRRTAGAASTGSTSEDREAHEKDVGRILDTPDMIRSRAKVLAIVNNALAFLRVREDYRCTFADAYSSAIRLEGDNHIVQNGRFDRTVLASDDQGTIDLWGDPTHRGNVIRGNQFRRCGRPFRHKPAHVAEYGNAVR